MIFFFFFGVKCRVLNLEHWALIIYSLLTMNWASRGTMAAYFPPYKGRYFSVWFPWWRTVCISTGRAVEPVIHHGSGRLWSRVALHRSRRGDVHPRLRRLHRRSERKHLPAQICEFSCCAAHLCLCVCVCFLQMFGLVSSSSIVSRFIQSLMEIRMELISRLTGANPQSQSKYFSDSERHMFETFSLRIGHVYEEEGKICQFWKKKGIFK